MLHCIHTLVFLGISYYSSIIQVTQTEYKVCYSHFWWTWTN